MLVAAALHFDDGIGVSQRNSRKATTTVNKAIARRQAATQQKQPQKSHLPNFRNTLLCAQRSKPCYCIIACRYHSTVRVWRSGGRLRNGRCPSRNKMVFTFENVKRTATLIETFEGSMARPTDGSLQNGMKSKLKKANSGALLEVSKRAIP